ncbi:MAG: DNA topoisomerase 4 subunit A [Christensenellaceae bacterium]|jgi:DNA gyrase subunit A|nr:DNA topoisomerase 4 subunit A [Christensenellaceae bacterium]
MNFDDLLDDNIDDDIKGAKKAKPQDVGASMKEKPQDIEPKAGKGAKAETEPVSANENSDSDNNSKPSGATKRAMKQPESVSSDSGDDGDNSGLIEKSIAQVMHESMIPYSEFVILDRALPRVEDGLKPVQRRILYAMHDLGLFPDRPFRKSAGIVGECLGKYHPHGDSSVYDAMVRLAQPFNMNMPLVWGQGNFGSDDGDSAAAMRYTEAKLSPLALELLRDIDKETVPFSLTFDDRNTEPDILPGRYPNLLTNGTTGIAVGLATNIPPHNLGEVIDAHIAFIDNPKITLKEVMKIIKGPDFPTGAWVIAGEELKTAYETGRGKVAMRAKIHIEVDGNDRRNIVISELPYQVNKVALQRSIADLRESKKGALQNITEIRDESDRNGMRVVIKIKKDQDAKEICDLLFKFTSLQCNFNFNMVAIAGGKPKQMGLLELIEYYVNYQREVIYKRCVFELNEAKERAHILEGLLIAIKNIDEVVKIIKTSKHTTEARKRLMDTFNLSERQAQAILDLRLARLTSLEVYKLEEELAGLLALIEKLTAIIGSKKLQFDVVKQEMLEIKKKYKIERRSKIISSIDEATITADDDEKPVEDVVITITPAGTVKRMAAKHFSMSQTEFREGGLTDINLVAIKTQTNKLLYFFTSVGNCFKVDPTEIADCRLKDKGTPFSKIVGALAEGEKPIAVYETEPDKLPETELVWLTSLGMIKRSKFADACGVVKSNFQVYKLREDRKDAVLRVDEFRAGRTIMLVASNGFVLNAATGDVPLQGRIAGGVKGMQIDDNVVCAGNSMCAPKGFVVAITNKGKIKKTAVGDIDKGTRYRKGLQFGALEKDEKIIFASYVKGDEDVVAELEGGEFAVVPLEILSPSDRTSKFKQISSAPKGSLVRAAYLHRRKINN